MGRRGADTKIAIYEPTCAQARWAHMRHFLSVCLYATGPKFRLDNNSYLNKSYS